MIELRAATPAHVGRIANRMREADRVECAAHGRTPKEALRVGLRASTLAFTAFRCGEPVAMLGVTPTNALEGTGRPWMLGTDAVYAGARALITYGPPIIAVMHSRFSRLENGVWAGNARAIRTLEHWGFTISADADLVSGYPFLRFWRDGKCAIH